ncbi:MAG: signal peptide peptidase SppA [Candidatus Krumholzibacteriota bacterium]|nr:signal peptide peptidase SppA [Candidatus Krumholzibacteriota bacterium]
MKSFFRSFFASLLAIVVTVLLIVAVVASKSSEKSKIEDHSWLVIDLYGSVSEYSPPGGVMSEIVGGKPETLQRILSNLEKVCVDDRIEGVILKMSEVNGTGRAMKEEIRGAVKNVQASGKKVYGFSDSMDRSLYYLASACDSIFMPPGGYMSFTGYSVTTQYLLGTLEKLGIRQNLHKIKDYKSAAEMLMDRKMSPAVRENREWMLEEFWQIFCDAVESDRGLSEEKITEAMEHALFQPVEAVEFGLIDGLKYWDELEALLLREGDEKLRKVSQSRYADEDPGKLGLKGDRKIAVIHAQGSIGGRKNRVDPMLGIMMGHESIVAELKKAEKDDDVAAIVFRVDSGGGESLASDMISHQVEVTSKVKPVIVSMVDVAASGGYMIAFKATRIVADRMTVTGSIGSISGKMNINGLHEKLGITHDFVTKGPRGLFYSPYKDFSDEEWEIFRKNHWADFNSWLQAVADTRGMTFEEAEKLAHGRIWSGRQAVDNRLIDEVGDLKKAIGIAAAEAGLGEKEKVTVVHLPEKKGFVEELMSGGSFTTVAEYVIYRYIRDDLADRWNFLTSQNKLMMEESMVN